MITTHQVLTYTIDDHPDPDRVYNWIRGHWHDLGEFTLQEAVDSLKGFADYFDLDLDYSVSIVPDRGEYIRASVNGFDLDRDALSALSYVRLWKYLQNHYLIHTPDLLAGNCPFTGVVYDEILLDGIRDFIAKPDKSNFQDLIDECTHKLLTALHGEGEYIYSDEGLRELCLANEYEFTINGAIY